MAQSIKSNPGLFLSLPVACLALTGCQVLGREIDDGIWFPILIVVSFIIFLIWLFRRHNGRKSLSNQNVASGWADGDASGHGGHTQMGNDDGGGDDGGGHHG